MSIEQLGSCICRAISFAVQSSLYIYCSFDVIALDKALPELCSMDMFTYSMIL